MPLRIAIRNLLLQWSMYIPYQIVGKVLNGLTCILSLSQLNHNQLELLNRVHLFYETFVTTHMHSVLLPKTYYQYILLVYHPLLG